ncbi:MAG: type II toxin-antitoxin system RelB/DinJ family antitoxin [Oscillospiraceae bacterium]|nr:type II toxin-antitoxin system RelB/DinJ family antitoxin [Oscillospiraceae bacterium]
MSTPLSVVTAPKTGTFQMRINPEIKKQVEKVYAACGMTLTDAVNTFIQQSLNVGGLPFLVTQDSKEALREQAITMLAKELQKREVSAQSEADWISEETMLEEFGE